MRAHLVLGLISIHLLTSCKTTTFRGDGATRSIANSPIVTTTVENPTLITENTPPTTPVSPTIPVNEIPATPSETPAVPNPPVVTPPVTNPPVVTPPVNPPVVVPPVIDPPPSRDIEFGSDKIFRIGDGYAYATSACAGTVTSYPLSGTTYYFQFEVYENNTQISLSIGRICGVDQVDKDTFALINERTKGIILGEKALPKQVEFGPENPWVPYPTFTVNKGIYSVVIRSKNIYGKVKEPGVPPDPTKDEYDDFLVGNIRLKANNLVKALQIYAD